MGCGCGKSSCGTCGSIEIGSSCCGNVSPATPLAPSCSVSACKEDHCETYISQQFYTSLKVANSWNVPDCGGSAVLYVAGIKSIAIGSNLWAADIGYFEVIGFNADSQQITIQNNCIDGNATEGTAIPACTEFTVVDPPVSAGGSGQPSLFPYVAVDFTAPLASTCLLITVTTVNGLVVGKNVQIGSGTYRISAISDSTHITICNDGSGITPGTSVIAQNEANQYQYPIILIDANPCTNPTVTSGSLLVCADDIAQPLTGPTEGAVPVLIDPETGEVEFQFFPGQSRTCTSILCCLTVVDGFAGPYVITVADSSEFVVGDLLQIGSRTDRFTITAIPDATHIQATVSPTPGATSDIDVGTSICIADCCEILQIEIDELGAVTDQESAAINTGTLSSGGTTLLETAEVNITITNPSSTRSMYVDVKVDTILGGNFTGANTSAAELSHEIQYSTNATPLADVVAGANHFFAFNDNAQPYTSQREYNAILTLAPGASITLNAKAQVSWTAPGGSTATYDLDNLTIGLKALGVIAN